MTAEEFTKKIADLNPPYKEIADLGYSDDFIEYFLKNFDIKRISNANHDDPIISLLKNYDLTSFSANDISFDSSLQEDEEYLFIGWDIGGDRLAIFKQSGRIVSYYPYSDAINFQCAENTSKFLDALFEIMKFSKEKMLRNYEENELNHRSAEVAYIAALYAGGEQYEDYYKSLRGVE